jgi:hypothetical protein
MKKMGKKQYKHALSCPPAPLNERGDAYTRTRDVSEVPDYHLIPSVLTQIGIAERLKRAAYDNN